MMDAALAVRDQLSGDTWLVLGNLDRDVALLGRRLPSGGAQAIIGRVMQSLLAFAGLAAESMVRDPGWRFMDTGRRIERGIQVATLLRATLAIDHDQATNSLLWESLLTAGESIITYRRRYQSHAQVETLLDLMVLDEGNPRSLAFQLARLAEDLPALPGAGGSPGRKSEAERLLIELAATIQVADPIALSVVGEGGMRYELMAFLDQAIGRLQRVAGAVGRRPVQPPAAAALGVPGPRPDHGVDLVTYRVRHRTDYQYESTVSSSYGEMHLLPRDIPGQVCHSTVVTIEPTPVDYRERTDFFGNRVAHFAILDAHDALTVTVTSTVDVSGRQATLPLLADQPWEQVRDATSGGTTPEILDARQYLLESPSVSTSPAVAAYAAPSFTPGRGLLDAVGDLMARIHRDFEFSPGATSVTTTVDELLEKGAGVCQDFAHLAIASLRVVGLAARYMSGYLETVPPEGQPRLRRRRRVARLGVGVRARRAAGSSSTRPTTSSSATAT